MKLSRSLSTYCWWRTKEWTVLKCRIDQQLFSLLTTYVRRIRRFGSQMDNFWMLNAIAVHFSCGWYGYSMWPIWSFRVADVVVADMICDRHGCGRCGLWPIWYRPGHLKCGNTASKNCQKLWIQRSITRKFGLGETLSESLSPNEKRLHLLVYLWSQSEFRTQRKSQRSKDWSKIGDDTKAAARQSLNCIKNQNSNMAKNDFQYGGLNSCILQCGTIMTLISPGDWTLQCGMWLWNRDSEFTTRHAAPCKLTRGSIWDDMPLNSPKTSAILEFYMVSISTTSPQSTCHSAPGFEILSNSDHPRRKKNDVMSIFKMADLSHLGF